MSAFLLLLLFLYGGPFGKPVNFAVFLFVSFFVCWLKKIINRGTGVIRVLRTSVGSGKKAFVLFMCTCIKSLSQIASLCLRQSTVNSDKGNVFFFNRIAQSKNRVHKTENSVLGKQKNKKAKKAECQLSENNNNKNNNNNNNKTKEDQKHTKS